MNLSLQNEKTSPQEDPWACPELKDTGTPWTGMIMKLETTPIENHQKNLKENNKYAKQFSNYVHSSTQVKQSYCLFFGNLS